MKSPYTGGPVRLMKENSTVEFRRENFKILHHYYKCTDSGKEFTTDELDQLNINQVYNQYRAKYKLPFPEEITSIRRKYKVSATKMSKILGLGVNSYGQYESGDIPTIANGRLIQAAADIDEFEKFVIASRNVIGEKTYKSLLKQIDNLKNDDKSEHRPVFCDDLPYVDKQPDEYTGYRKFNTEKIAQIISYFSSQTRLFKPKLNEILFQCDLLHFNRTAFSITGAAYKTVSDWGSVPIDSNNLYARLEKHNFVAIRSSMKENSNFADYLEGLLKVDLSAFSESEIKVMDEIADVFRHKTVEQVLEFTQSQTLDNLPNTGSLINFIEHGFSVSALE